jgi:hypothetical protein
MNMILNRRRPIAFLLAEASILLLLAGCGSKAVNPNANNPGIAGGSSSSQYNTYIGTQSVQWGGVGYQKLGFQYGGVWGMALDDKTDYFSYQNVGHEGSYSFAPNEPVSLPPDQPTVGQLEGSGFLTLTSATGASGNAGYALEVPGSATLVRPGPDYFAPVFSVETSQCLQMPTASTYQFVALGTPNPADPVNHVVYGSVQAQSSGLNWTFSKLSMFAFDGTDLKPTQLPAGECGETPEGYAINIARSTATNNLPVTAQIGPTGFFLIDQGQGDPSLFGAGSNGLPIPISPGPTGPLGLIGVQQPSSQLSTSAVVGAGYMGFEYDPINDTLGEDQLGQLGDGTVTIHGTLPVAFAGGGSGTAMTGNSFLNDDVAMPDTSANGAISIDLGSQDSQNGLYKNVTVQVPDTYQTCAFTPFGVQDTNGNWFACKYTGVAVVGNPNGKYAIFISVNELGQTTRSNSPYAALEFFLFQQ